MTTLQTIHCDKCDISWLVGIDDKDITDKGSGGKTFIAFGNDEIKSAPKISKTKPCKKCGKLCKVESSTSKKVAM
jgi:hypothetical protein